MSDESASNITEHAATINADVNPQRTTEITYFVEYGTTTSYGQSVPNPPETIRWVTCGLECEGEAETPRPVSVNLTELQAGTTYHYRVVASNGSGVEHYGPDATFTTPSSGAGPEPTGENGGAETGGASSISETGATLNGVVTAWGWREATYVFEYGRSTSYGKSVPTPPGVIGGRATCGLPCGPPHSERFPVSESLTELAPNTTYHYRLVSTSNGYTSYGKDATFTTHEGFVEPLNIAAPSTTGGEVSPPEAGGSGQAGSSSTATGSGASSLTSGVTPLVSPTKKLTKALKLCSKRPKSKRAVCVKQARKAYAATAAKSKRR